ncbi:MAG: VOC family protein [Acidimicrobiia bacterium]
MQKPGRLIAVSAVLAAAVLAVAAPSASAKTTTTTTPPTTLPIGTVPPTDGAGATSTGTGKILMLKIYVGDIAKAQQFYGNVFGAKGSLTVGSKALIVGLPNGGPGLVLLQKGKGDKDKHGAFIVQVPDLEAAKALALANGAKEQGTFAGAPTGTVAKSVDVLDPWGNQVEILQIGGS